MSKDWDDQVKEEAARLSESLVPYTSLISGDAVLTLIRDTVIKKAATAALNAGYSGAMNDGGARSSVNEFVTFLDGIRWVLHGNAGKYQPIVDEYSKSQDPEYPKYLELKKKFETN